MIMKALLLTALLFLSSVAHAVPYDVLLSWTAPVAREDGSALLQEELGVYTISITAPDGSVVGTPALATETSKTIALDKGEGVYVFTMMASDIEGLTSNPASANYNQIAPSSRPDFDGSTFSIELRCPSNDCQVVVQ